MSGAGPVRAFLKRRRDARGQGGITLVEILVATAITGVMVVPVGAWLVLSLSTVGPTASRFSDASQARVLNTYVSRDVASAEILLDATFLAGSPTADCLGGEGGGSVVLEVLSLVPAGWKRIVYTEHIVTSSASSLWRRVCDNGNRTLEDEVEILRGVDVSTPAASCTPACDATDLAERRQVRLSATVRGETVAVSAAQRATVDPAQIAATGGFAPTPVIREVSRVVPDDGSARLSLVLDSSLSSDLLGDIVSRSWSVSGPGAVDVSDPAAVQPTFDFPNEGDYVVTLTVTDDSGQSASVTKTVVVLNRAPEVSASVDDSQGGVGEPFSFTASATDPDGDPITTWEWDFGDGVDTAIGATGDSPVVTYTTEATPGTREVTVKVTDALGAFGVGRVIISLASGPVPEIVITPDPVVTSVGLPRLGSVGGSAPTTLDATFAPDVTADVRWELVRPGGTVALDSSTSDTWERTFDSALTGDFEIVMYDEVTGAELGRRGLRVNAAPVASFTSPVGGAYPFDATFTDTSTDDQGIVAWSWDFGFFGRAGWTSTVPSPSHTFTDPGTYQVVLSVTDTDGITSLRTATVTVTGVPPQPLPPTWVGSAVTFTAVPGATSFRVATEHLDDDGCRNPGINATVDAVAQYDPSGVYSVSGGVNTCTGTNRRTVASVQVEAGPGNLSPPSVQAVRTL